MSPNLYSSPVFGDSYSGSLREFQRDIVNPILVQFLHILEFFEILFAKVASFLWGLSPRVSKVIDHFNEVCFFVWLLRTTIPMPF